MRTASWIAIVLGGVGSAGLTLYEGDSGSILMTLFVGWVVLPFTAFACINLMSGSWAVRMQSKARVLAIVLAPVSLAIYGRVAFGPPRAQPAFAFLMIPLVSWLLIAIAAILSRKGPAAGGNS